MNKGCMWLYSSDCCPALTQTYNFGAETHLGAGVMSAFLFPSPAIARPVTSTFVGTKALRKCPRRFWLHCHECCHALMLGCQNSPWWQSCERCNNFLSSFWPLLLTRFEQHGPHMWCALIGTRRELDAYVIWAAFEWGLNTSWCRQKLPRYPQRQGIATSCVVATWT